MPPSELAELPLEELDAQTAVAWRQRDNHSANVGEHLAVLHLRHGWSIREIAAHYHRPKSTVHRLARPHIVAMREQEHADAQG